MPFTRTVAVHVPPWPGLSVVGPEIMTCMVGEGVGVGGIRVGDGDCIGDGEARTIDVVFATVVFAVVVVEALDALVAA